MSIFASDLYGKHLAIELIDYLRPEAKFADLAALRDQIEADAAAAKIALTDSA